MSAPEIARALGGALRSGEWWRCRCPVHDSGGATLGLRDGERGLIVKCFAGCDPRDVLAELRLRQLIEGSGAPQHRAQPTPSNARAYDDAHRIAAARRLWEEALETRGSPVVSYLAGRGITIPLPPSLRYAPVLKHQSGVYLPAMVARIENIAGELIGIHRTFLRPDGSGKANAEPQKAMLGRAAGGAARLAPAAETLMVGEGLESVLAGMVATNLPGWSALSTSGLVGLILPPIVQHVVILADHDVSGAGELAARTAGVRWVAEGRRVQLAMPPERGSDFNDVLLGRAYAGVTETHDVAA